MNKYNKQEYNVPDERKVLYGEVTTDYKTIDIMLNMLPKHVWTNKNYRWLDVGCGQGYISYAIYIRLLNGIKYMFATQKECSNHIIKNMLFMIDVNVYHANTLKHMFGEDANIIIDNFITPSNKNVNIIGTPDIIISNPPYNINGTINTPTNNKSKHSDGITVWRDFLYKSLNILKKNGHLCFINPSIWFRVDKHNIHKNIISNYTLLKTICFTATQTSKMFHGKAQTPIVIYTIQNVQPTSNVVKMWDTSVNNFVDYPTCVKTPLPLNDYNFILNINKYIKLYGHLNIIKTNCISSKNKLSSSFSETYPHKCVKTRLGDGTIIYNYASLPTNYQYDKKIIMANKMYGKPLLDLDGKYGISTRDSYIIMMGIKSKKDMEILCDYINSDFVQRIFNCFRYRMRYLEREAFLFVPDVLSYLKQNSNKTMEDLIINL